MEKKINLLTLKLLFEEGVVEDYLNYSKVNNRELSTLSSFVEEIEKNCSKINIFNGYYYDYSIPQISKQFDILKVSKEYIINIELKETSTEVAIKKQLKENNYYLRSTGREVWTFTYVKSTNSLYEYRAEDDKLELMDNFRGFVEWLEGKEIDYFFDEDLNEVFNPKKYLVSVFNDTDRFLNNHYFLNDLQQRFKKEFEESDKLFRAIKGEAGSGKTLLLYDIAREYINRAKNILIIHCAQLNFGHHNLIANGWNITPIRTYSSFLKPDLEAIFIDEAQRLTEYQLDCITEFARQNDVQVFFSYDPAQYLHIKERTSDIANKILGLNSEVINKILTGKIRNNEEINIFIKKIFNAQHNHTTNFDFRRFIDVVYFNDITDANDYTRELIHSSKGEATVLGLTPDVVTVREYQRYNSSQANLNAHEVIGQEFNHIVLTLGDYLAYNANGELTATCVSYYDVERMFYQLATRAKEKLTIIIIENSAIAKRVVKILNQ